MTTDIADIRSGVKKTAWGFFLVLFNINLGTVNILPDWAGFMMMVSALTFIALEEGSAGLLRPIGIILAVWNIIEWGLDIFGLGGYLDFISVIPAILNIYFCFQLFTNLAAIAETYSCPQRKKLLVFRNIYVITTVISIVFLYLDILNINFDVYFTVTYAFAIINVIMALCILFTLFSLSSSLKNQD